MANWTMIVTRQLESIKVTETKQFNKHNKVRPDTMHMCPDALCIAIFINYHLGRTYGFLAHVPDY